MSGKEAIIEKIRQDARQKANSTLEEGTKKAHEAIAIAYNDAKIYKEKNLEEGYAEREEIIARKITVANLEAKKAYLKAKKEVIDRAFDEAIGLIKADKKGYKALISRMLKFAEDGDVVIVSQSDKGVITEKFVVDEAAKYGVKVKAKADGSFVGGLMICGSGADKNLTLEAELGEVRREYEPAIADVLFKEDGSVENV